MKETSSTPFSVPVPRLRSLLHRLQKLPAPDGEASRPLDQLMIFLDDPPGNIRDRWKAGVKMCARWGVACTRSSVWRLYRAHVLEWRLRLAHEARPGAKDTPESLVAQAAEMIAARTVEILAHPNLSPVSFTGLARMECRRQALELSRAKFQLLREQKFDLVMNAFATQIDRNPKAREAFDQLCAILEVENPRDGEVAA